MSIVRSRPNPGPRKANQPRRRHNAIDMRGIILEAAERRLIADGPEAIRLQEIAADVGISHPLILHHFGSRDGLIEAMVAHGFATLDEQFLKGWPSEKSPDIEGVLQRFYEVASNHGVARLLAWLTLSGQSIKPGVLEGAANQMHAGRIRRAEAEGRPVPRKEQTLFAASFLGILVLGDALFGPSVRSAMGAGSDPASTARFRRSLAKLLERMEQLGTAGSPRMTPGDEPR